MEECRKVTGREREKQEGGDGRRSEDRGRGGGGEEKEGDESTGREEEESAERLREASVGVVMEVTGEGGREGGKLRKSCNCSNGNSIAHNSISIAPPPMELSNLFRTYIARCVDHILPPSFLPRDITSCIPAHSGDKCRGRDL